MIEEFSVIANINSNKREVFLNPFKIFRFEKKEQYKRLEQVTLVVTSDSYPEKTLIPEITINGTKLVTSYTYTISSTKSEDDYYFLIRADEIIDADFDLTFRINNIIYKKAKLFVTKDEAENLFSFDKNGVAFTDTNASFQLIRTNPKLSGNIKLVVDSDENLYLDTFKVSENLSKFSYRHQSVSSESNYSTDVRNIFKTLDSVDLYKVPENSTKAHNIHTDFEDQYETTYEYGVESNDDRLYSENFKCLAPLWINKNLPDFFVIFRINDLYDNDSYNGNMNDTETFKRFLKECDVVKCFDMRKSSPLGKYINKHFDNIEEYPGSVLLQFKEQENQNNFSNGINSWMGISVDTGLFVKKDEMSYFLNQKITAGNQTDFNQFIIEGFERNRLLCPNIINIEFMFDDDVDNMSMHRYFGLYLKENDFLEYDFIEKKKDTNKQRIGIVKYDSAGQEINDEMISGNDSILDDAKYKDRLFFAISSTIQKRLKEKNDLNIFLNDYIKKGSYKNYQNNNCVQIPATYKNFISLKFKKQIEPGEHFRICVPDFAFEEFEIPVIFEILASNDHRLASTNSFISPYLNINNSTDSGNDYVYYREQEGKPTDSSSYNASDNKQQYYFQMKSGESYSQFPIMNIVKYQTKYGGINKVHQTEVNELGLTTYPYVFRLTFYTQDEFDNNNLALLDEQLKRLSKCFEILEKGFNFEIHLQEHSDDSISLLSNYDNAYFQHITSDIINNGDVCIERRKTDLHLENSNIEVSTANTCFDDLKVDSVIENGTKKDETLVYFGNEDLDIYLTNLDNKINYYKDSTILFAPLNFEILGWRKTSIVKFANFGEFNYEVENENETQVLPNTLVRTGSKTFSKLNYFDVNSISFSYESLFEKYGYQDNDVDYFELLLKDETEYDKLKRQWEKTDMLDKTTELYQRMTTLKQEIIDIQSFKDSLYRYNTKGFSDTLYLQRNNIQLNQNILQSPYHSNKYIISSPKPIVLDNNSIVNFYTFDTLHMALMGILPIKDFDMMIDNVSTISYKNNQKLYIPKNTNVWVDNDAEEYNIKSGIFYTVEKGKFKNTNLSQGTSFIIFGDKVYYNNGTSDKLVTSELNNRHLTTYGYNSMTILSQIKDSIDIDYEITSPEIKFDDFFLNWDQYNELRYPILTPTICNWKGVGMYYDHDSILKLKNLSKKDYKNISKGYIPTFSNDVFVDTDLNISVSFDSLVKDETGTNDYFSYLKNTKLTDSVNMFLTDKQKPIYTIGYYNKYVNTLEFIILGVKFSLSFSTNQFVKEISLQNYNRYEIYIINDFNGQKDEMFINTIENVILIIFHNFNYHQLKANNNIFYGDTGKLKCFDGYTWQKTDEYLDVNKSEIDNVNVHIPLKNRHGIDKELTSDKIVQLITYKDSENPYQQTYNDELWVMDSSLHTDSDKIVFTLGQTNLLVSNQKPNVDELIYEINETVRSTFSFIQSDRTKFQNWLLNPEYKDVSSFYVNDEKLTDSEKFNLMVNDFVDSFQESNLKVYIKSYKGNDITIKTVETTDEYKPFKIGYEIMNNVKYCIDFYNPNFIDMFEYDLNETSDLISRLKTNFVLSNTTISNINTIKNYYGLKVYDSVKSAQQSPINLFCIEDKSIIESDWNKAFYRLYDGLKFTRVNGFVPGIAKKSFFGSKAMKIETKDMVIRNWDEGGVSSKINYVTDTTMVNNENLFDNILNVTINLSQAFFNNFINTEDFETFGMNWKVLGFETENARNNFIKKTLVDYFNFDTKGNLKVYYCDRLKFEIQTVVLTEPEDLSKWSELTNFETSFIRNNDEILLNLVLKDVSKKYYFEYTLKSNK